MSKQIDDKNAKARAKAEDKPYYKLVTNYERACPYCDSLLVTTDNRMGQECKCGIWSVSWSKPNEYIYTPNQLNGDSDE